MNAITEQLLDCEKLQPVEDIIAELKGTLPWLWHRRFNIGPNQGYIGEGPLFGACAGFHYHTRTYNVLHEVSHAVEMTLLPSSEWQKRVLQDNFDMQILTYQDVMGRRYFEPETMQASERECRVGGIQLRLLEAGGYDTKEFVENYVLTLQYVKDSYFGGHCPSNAHDPAKYTAKQKQWVAVRTRLLLDAYEKFTLNDIQERWGQVMAWLDTH